MNHHADKIDYSFADGPFEPDTGGVVQEVHTCPACGMTDMTISR
jgi:hypothetical protein